MTHNEHENAWSDYLAKIIKEYNSSPNEFLRQRTISLCLHPNCQTQAKRYYKEMQKCSFCSQNILPNLSDSPVGKPFEFELLPKCSPMTISHAYNFHLMKKYSNIFAPKEVSHVVDIGGGYGNLCRLFKNCFDYKGRYQIVDFPAMLDIQKKYLEQNAVTDVDFLPLDMDQLLPKDGETSMLIATFSMSEMPLATRALIEQHLTKYDYIFIAHNSKFDGVDNIEYFKNLKATLSVDFEIDYFRDPHRGLNMWYMICKRKGIK